MKPGFHGWPPSYLIRYTPSAYTMTGMTAANNTVLAVTIPVAYRTSPWASLARIGRTAIIGNDDWTI